MADSATWKLIDNYFIFKEHTGISALAKQAVVGLAIAFLYYCVTSDNTFASHREILSTSIDDEYDYVIVGGGSAGSVLAARLSEDGMSKVLLLEAGGFYDENPHFHIPVFWTRLINTTHDWGYFSEAQNYSCLGVKGQRSYWPRGKVLGGSSVLNCLLYSRGSRHDYDSWAANGLSGWSYNDVLPYFMKSENIQIKELKSSRYHRLGGLMAVMEGDMTQLSELFLQAGEELNFSVNDYNGAHQSGFSKPQITSKKGVRGSTGLLFLGQRGKRANLDVVINAMATKVDINNKKARGVFYTHNGGKLYVKARNEVILCAGVVGSPQLLMLSGIGPRDHLQALNISVIKDLLVGNNLQDPLSLSMTSKINKSIGLTENAINSVWSKFKYTYFGKGPQSTAGSEGTAFFCTERNGTLNEDCNIQAVLFSSHSNMNIYNFKEGIAKEYLAENPNVNGINFQLHLLKPKSKGFLRLRSTDPYDHPFINPLYLSDRRDIEEYIKGIRIWERFLQTNTISELGVDINEMKMSFCSEHKFRSNEYWECFIRHLAVTSYSPTSTCKMGANDDSTAVVNSQLLVKGVEGLRVVDASVIPNSISGAANAPVIMVAEKAADMIRKINSVKHVRQNLPK